MCLVKARIQTQSDLCKTDIQASSTHTKDRLLCTFITWQPLLFFSKHLLNTDGKKEETIFTGQNYVIIKNMNSKIYRDQHTQAAYG